MNVLFVLPLLPIAGALWLALPYGQGRHVAAVICTFAALTAVIAAVFAGDASVGIRYFLTTDVSVFELDADVRPALLLFGSLWAAASLLNRERGSGPAGIPLLIALSGAITVALAIQGPAVFCGMLVTGFGVCAIVAGEHGAGRRRAIRALTVFLVVGFLLIFEVLIHGQAEPRTGMSAEFAGMIILAVVLMAGLPPAHVWQLRTLPYASAPSALLLVVAPAGVALTGGQKLLSGSGEEAAIACVVLAITGTAWSAFAGAMQRTAPATLAYAVAATASLLLLSLPVGPGQPAISWLLVSLLASLGALVLFRLQPSGFTRKAGMMFVALLYGVAAGGFVFQAADAETGIGRLPATVTAIFAAMAFAVASRRNAVSPAREKVTGPASLALLFATLAPFGLGAAWLSGADELAAVLPGAAGIGLGMLLHRRFRAPGGPGTWSRYGARIAENTVMASMHGVEQFCEHRLPRFRDRLQGYFLSLWRGKSWAARVARLESLLAVWPATALAVLFLAIAIGVLLIG